ncbi:MAG: hypothetical protein V4726_00355 [Verrucomicrobiota bacterium]
MWNASVYLLNIDYWRRFIEICSVFQYLNFTGINFRRLRRRKNHVVQKAALAEAARLRGAGAHAPSARHFKKFRGHCQSGAEGRFEMITDYWRCRGRSRRLRAAGGEFFLNPYPVDGQDVMLTCR